MYYNEVQKLLLIISSIIILIVAGLLITKLTLFSSNYYFNYLTKYNKNQFVISQLLVPYFLGNGIIILLKTPKIMDFEIMVNSSMILLLIPIIIRSRYIEDLFFDPEKRTIRIRWEILLISLLIMSAFRVLFEIGIRIGKVE
jgi:hypothetical protein